MSVEQLDIIDIVSIDKAGNVVLTISDHLEWSRNVEHQAKLQAKFNKYLAFVESGEILIRYPEAKERPIIIRVVFRHKPDSEGWAFLARAQQVIEAAGFKLRSEVFAESYDN